MPHLHTVTRLAKVVNVPVPYFYCEDAELAEAIIKFSALDKTERKRFLGLMGECSRPHGRVIEDRDNTISPPR